LDNEDFVKLISKIRETKEGIQFEFDEWLSLSLRAIAKQSVMCEIASPAKAVS
jgi:hypothetical protein